MSVRIFQPARSATTSGQGKTKHWVLQFTPESPRPIDPLMGWTGQTDTSAQVRMTFDTREEAVEYARRHGLAYTVEDAQKRAHRPRGYGDNFSPDRRVPWSH